MTWITRLFDVVPESDYLTERNRADAAEAGARIALKEAEQLALIVEKLKTETEELAAERYRLAIENQRLREEMNDYSGAIANQKLHDLHARQPAL